jgi:hypothetical protein
MVNHEQSVVTVAIRPLHSKPLPQGILSAMGIFCQLTGSCAVFNVHGADGLRRHFLRKGSKAL